nr:amidohydrolase family protein [Roseivivax isoporae]
MTEIRPVLPPRARSVRVRLTGATVLRGGMLQRRSVAIEDGRISKGPLPEVDLSGFLVLPGIVDLHAERPIPQHAVPQHAGARHTATFLAAIEREAAANGVTTAWIAQGWSWEGGTAAPEAAQAFLAAHEGFVATRGLIDLRVSLSCETHTVETRDALLAAVRRHRVDLVLFTDRLSQLVRSGAAPSLPGARADLASRMRRAAGERREVPRHLCRLAEGFDTLGVTYGSLDDADGETRETWAMIGAKLCARPVSRKAAALSRAVGDPVAVPAAQVLDESGTAHDLVRDGLCSALISNGVYSALADAAFGLVEAGTLSLPQAWALISSGPAEILRLPDRGVIDYGRRADLTLVNARTRSIEGTICAGRIAHLAGEAADRFVQSSGAVSALAATG